MAVLDEVRARGVEGDAMAAVFSRISFFVNASIRFLEEIAKMRAFTKMWDEIGEKRYGVTDAKARRFRYGVQVNSLGLTEQQPENNAIRIALEMLGVVLSRDARARAVQLPAWNEALGLPRPWDQQWSLRTQQIMAYETDILEHGDIFEGSVVMQRRVDELIAEARKEIAKVEELGGAVKAVESSYFKQRLVESNARRVRRIETGEQKVVGVNCFQQTEPSPLTADIEGAIFRSDPGAEKEQIERLQAFRSERSKKEVDVALQALSDAVKASDNVMHASIRCAHAGVTTGEWSDTLRKVFGEYRAPTGVSGQAAQASEELVELRARLKTLSDRIGHTPRFLVGKPGLDGHSNGAEQIAVRARDVGMDVIYQGIRLTVEEIVATAQQEDVDAIGLSILSGSHMALVPVMLEQLSKAGMSDVPLIIGGIIPEDDAKALRKLGVAGVYTPKNFELSKIMGDIVAMIEQRQAA
jgi:(2R)-ethylmalonyl-CoA mutase